MNLPSMSSILYRTTVSFCFIVHPRSASTLFTSMRLLTLTWIGTYQINKLTVVIYWGYSECGERIFEVGEYII